MSDSELPKKPNPRKKAPAPPVDAGEGWDDLPAAPAAAPPAPGGDPFDLGEIDHLLAGAEPSYPGEATEVGELGRGAPPPHRMSIDVGHDDPHASPTAAYEAAPSDEGYQEDPLVAPPERLSDADADAVAAEVDADALVERPARGWHEPTAELRQPTSRRASSRLETAPVYESDALRDLDLGLGPDPVAEVESMAPGARSRHPGHEPDQPVAPRIRARHSAAEPDSGPVISTDLDDDAFAAAAAAANQALAPEPLPAVDSAPIMLEPEPEPAPMPDPIPEAEPEVELEPAPMPPPMAEPEPEPEPLAASDFEPAEPPTAPAPAASPPAAPPLRSRATITGTGLPAAPRLPTPMATPAAVRNPTPMATPVAPRAPSPAVAAAVASGERTVLTDNATFRQESQRLARARDWAKLAALTSDAVDNAAWATLPETRAALLLDLARMYRDRLKDLAGAEETFRRLTQVEPAHADAVEFLSVRYRERNDYRALYDLYAGAIKETWDPNQRLEWTRETVEIAETRLKSTDLAIDAWERLYELGDAVDETSRALSEVYRRAKRWDRLAEFLSRRAAALSGAERVVMLRTVSEAYLSGMRDHEKAAEILAQILAERPDDPIALLAQARVLARRKDWDGLAELGALPLTGLPAAAVLDFRRLVADALWSAGDLERALVAYERVLELDADDHDALRAKEEYLARTGKSEALVGFLSQRAQREKSLEVRAKLLTRAATIAEKELDDPRLAVSLWERRAEVAQELAAAAAAAAPPGSALSPSDGALEAFTALAQLYDTLGDNAGVARALEGQLKLLRAPQQRIELLRKLGEHCAQRLGDDTRAEACWKEVLSIVPDDWTVRDELIALHRRRGDFEALDRTLSGQAWRAVDDASVLRYWRAAAKNVDDNIPDARRAVRAWLRVVDLAPDDGDALRALVGHQRSLGQPREVIAAEEAELRVIHDTGARIERGLDIAKLWEGQADRAAALAAYERVLRWSPTQPDALAAVARLRGPAQAGVALGALEVATAAVEAAPARIALLRLGLGLLDGEDKLGRFHALRRILWLSGRDAEVLGECVAAAREAGAWSELVAIYLDMAAEATGDDARAALHRELAALYKDKLNDPNRAFLVLQAIGLSSVSRAGIAEALAELAGTTGRHEDLLALMDVSARASNDLETRRAALRARAAISSARINDAERAFHEQVRLLALDPRDGAALAEAQRLAASRGLWRPLDALYAELGDRAQGLAQRVELMRARHRVRAQELKDPSAALDMLLAIYRLDPAAEGLERELTDAAEAQNAWDKVLPVLEARIRASAEAASADELSRIAALHEDKRSDRERALELYAEAFVLRPTDTTLPAKLERLAEATGRRELLVGAYRLAAARSRDPEQVLELYRKITALYTTLGKERDEDALDVHHRILQLMPAAAASLEVVIEHHRKAQGWRDLRDRLQQSAPLMPKDDTGRRIERELEIARLSREKLQDPETALATYAHILDLAPDNEEALAGVRSLTTGQVDPSLELRRLRIELGRATGPRRIEIRLSMARLQREQLDDPMGAITTLRELCNEAGADGPGFAPLSDLLRAQSQWSDLTDLIEARADVLEERAARVAAFEQAIKVCDEHPTATSAESKERLCRRLLEERPEDGDNRRQLLSLYRTGARYPELADLLGRTLARQLETDAEPSEVADTEWELARVLDKALGKLADAEATLAARTKRLSGGAAGDEDMETLLARASLELRAGQFEAWLALREKQARKLPAAQGALVLCHLAEACDERGPDTASKVAAYYREARALDPANQPAMEALKAIGRRAKGWRASAALLPEPDEAKLSWSERAARLRARGAALLLTDGVQAASWLTRAVAVDPDHYPAWDALAQLMATRGDHAAALEARRASLAAFERSTGPEPARLREHAERIEQLAEAMRVVGEDDRAARLSQRAFDLMPTFPAAALSVADQRLGQDDVAGAYAIYDRVLSGRGEPLDDRTRLHATYRRGALAARLERPEQAIDDLREGLRIDPLHSGVLNAIADVFADQGRVAAAIQHSIQALLVDPEPTHRGQLYARLGRLWEDRLARPDEAGVCYDLAINAGGDQADADGDLMVRALRHYRRSGKAERALAVIERLLPTTTDPTQLAALWAERGGILAATDEDKAIEAFDMALSYDPGNSGAIDGLSEVLEKRGDWEQLIQIHEARTESGGPAERAAAMRSLARISVEKLNDKARAERYLRGAVELAPTREDWERLLELYGDDAARKDDKRTAIAGLMALAGPWMPRVIELGKLLVAEGERRWAWSLLSLLMASNLPDPQLKALVLELRKEFEKADNAGALSPETRLSVRHPDLTPALFGVLAELDGMVQLGPPTPEAAGATGVAKLDARTAAGKTFAAVSAQLGLEGAVLMRALELPAPFVVLDSEVPTVIVRSEVLQLLPVAETNYLFASTLELARPGARVLQSLSVDELGRLVPALLAACGLESSDNPDVRALEGRIRAGVEPSKLGAWAERLREVAAEVAGKPGAGAAVAERLRHGVIETARRVGLVAAADVRFVARLMTRLDDGLPKMPTVGKLDDLDDFIGGAPTVQALLAFAATSAFGRALLGG
ncbi:MAG: hypothetical protein IT370_24565 [Deltaproteobacteria bacterium]|nr:hypothetical protein [Deltaproteobacteria bacterium]